MNDFYNKEENYEMPTTSNYMNFEEGDNKFRVLGSFAEKTAIQGIEYWKTVNGKRNPIRLRKNADGTTPSVPMSELEVNKFGDLDMPKYFWAFPVWNYGAKRVQILEITQKTVLKPIQSYIGNKKWGNPRDYDIIVNQGKEGDKTVYTVTVDPKEEVEDSIIDSYVAMDINMQAMFDGEDPFAGSDEDESIANGAVAAGL